MGFWESLVEYNLQKLNFLLNVDYDGQVNACVEKMHHADFLTPILQMNWK